MIDFSTLKSLSIPEGSVAKITSNGTTLWEKVIGRIPKEYQEVEWLQSAGTSGPYIDLGFAFDTKGKTEMSQYIVNTTIAYTFGAAEKSGILRYLLTCPYTGANTGFFGSNGSNYIQSGADMEVGKFNEMVYLARKNNLWVYNNTNGSKSENISSQAEYTMTNNLYLFGQNYNGSARTGAGTRRIGYFRYYDKNDTLICDLVPCYRKSDGVMGMYDMARSIFLTKAGGGEWTKGADVK